MSTDEPSIELSADSDAERAGMPSTRPMTLRQQVTPILKKYGLCKCGRHKTSPNFAYHVCIEQGLRFDLERLCQEIAREALESLLDSELANTCVCQLADTAVCDHNWSLCNEIRERLSQQDTRSTVSDTKSSEIASGQLTQKPPQEEPK